MSTNNIKLAYMSLMWSHGNLVTEDFSGWLDEVAEAGYNGVSLFQEQLDRVMEDLAVEQLLSDRQLGLASVNYGIDPTLTGLRETCESMQTLGAHHLVAVGGMASREADPGVVADVLNRIGETALEFGVRAGYHNHTGTTGETLEQTENLLALTDPEKFFGFLDTGHATKDFAGHPVAGRAVLFLERNWDRMDFIEFKDWSEAHDLNTDVGAGACNFDGVFNLLTEREYHGWITVEQNGPMGNKTPFESAKASCDFIRTGLSI